MLALVGIHGCGKHANSAKVQKRQTVTRRWLSPEPQARLTPWTRHPYETRWCLDNILNPYCQTQSLHAVTTFNSQLPWLIGPTAAIPFGSPFFRDSELGHYSCTTLSAFLGAKCKGSFK
jgi:hypothetical protein